MFCSSAASAADIRQGPFNPGGTGTITGQILLENGKPMPGGIAAFFRVDSPYPLKFGSLHRIPEHIATVDEKGRFTGVLPAGRYYLGVIVKDGPSSPGPPGTGEKTFSAVDDEKNRRIFKIEPDEIKDLGFIHVTTLKPDRKMDDFFTIRGKMVNQEGKPFNGAWIMVRRNPHSKRPDLISEKITENGEFDLQLPPGGPYFLIAKDSPGMGRPQAGSYVGSYTGPEPVFGQNMPEPNPQPLSGSPGETITGIQILMIEVPDSELRKEKMQGHPNRQQHQPQVFPGNEHLGREDSLRD